jgi:hypothetical protein
VHKNTTDKNREKQAVEVIGRSRLIEMLHRAGLEVARPERDYGVDLVAYIHLKRGSKSLIALPLQLKASSFEQFSIDKKYAKISGLIIVYIWHVRDRESSDIYALTYRQAVEIYEKLRRKQNKSWKKHGTYARTRASKKLKGLLKDYKMTEEEWVRIVAGKKNMKKPIFGQLSNKRSTTSISLPAKVWSLLERVKRDRQDPTLSDTVRVLLLQRLTENGYLEGRKRSAVGFTA